MKDFEEEKIIEHDKIRRSGDDGFMPVRTKQDEKGYTQRKTSDQQRVAERRKYEPGIFIASRCARRKETLQSLREQFERTKREATMKADRSRALSRNFDEGRK